MDNIYTKGENKHLARRSKPQQQKGSKPLETLMWSKAAKSIMAAEATGMINDNSNVGISHLSCSRRGRRVGESSEGYNTRTEGQIVT